MGIGVNTTDPLAASVHGTNPQNLVSADKIIREKNYRARFVLDPSTARCTLAVQANGRRPQFICRGALVIARWKRSLG